MQILRAFFRQIMVQILLFAKKLYFRAFESNRYAYSPSQEVFFFIDLQFGPAILTYYTTQSTKIFPPLGFYQLLHKVM